MFRPFVDALEANTLLANDLLELAGTTRDQIETQQNASVLVWYKFVELCAVRSADAHFGYRVGRHSAIASLPNLGGIAGRPMSLGDQINRMVLDAASISNLGRYTVLNDGETTELRLKRRFRPVETPGQIDAFGFGFFEQVLRSALGKSLDGSQLAVRLSQPESVPPNALEGCLPKTGDILGPVYRFPSIWLGYAMGQGVQTLQPAIEIDFLTSVRQIIRDNISNTKLTSEVVAILSGTSLRTLQSRLKACHTTFRQELASARIDEALRLLSGTDRSVENIARCVGYEDASSFIRAFKSAKGQTPSAFRARM